MHSIDDVRALQQPSRRCGASSSLALIVQRRAVALAGPREQAERIHDRLAGVPPTRPVLDDDDDRRSTATPTNGPITAANIAMDDPHFYAVTLKNFAAPWTNRDQTVFVPLNDYIATRHRHGPRRRAVQSVLSADILYTAAACRRPPRRRSNDHYVALEIDDARPASTGSSSPTTQSARLRHAAAATAGAITTRAAAEAFFIAGTNRAMFRFTLMNHMCQDMEQVHDTSRAAGSHPPGRERSPGGDSRVFLNNCIGCHSGMDPLAQAFAYYDFDETASAGMRRTRRARCSRSTSTTTTNFKPRLRHAGRPLEQPLAPGPERAARLELATARLEATAPSRWARSSPARTAFAQCQVKKVFKAVCLRDPVDASRPRQVDAMTTLQRRLRLEAGLRASPQCIAWASRPSVRESGRCSTQS